MAWRTYRHPSESNGDDVVSTEDARVDNVESVTAPADPAVQLQVELNAAKAEVAEWQDRFLRKAAELENYRKRAEKDKVDAVVSAKGSVLLEFLLVLDACERALKSLEDAPPQGSDLQQYKEGVQLLYKQLMDTMSRIGVKPLETEGKPFDPHLHEALSREENIELKENTVIRELRRGYLYQDKLLRPAQVVVAFHPVRKD